MGIFTIAGCLAAALISWLICTNALVIGTKRGLIDRPDGIRKLHYGAVPLLGGFAVIVPFLIVAVSYMLLVQAEPTLGVAAACMAATVVVGYLDDHRGMNVRNRLLALCAIVGAACLLDSEFVLHTLRLNFVRLQISLDPFATLATIFIVVGFVNAANLADGINGQLLGSIMVWCAFLLIYMPYERTPFLALLASVAVALVFNLRGKLFSGSVGSYALPMFIGLSTIALYRRAGGAFHAELPVYWFWLPVVDCMRLFAWRALNRRSPFSADRNHIHHLLMSLTGNRLAAPLYLLLLAVPGVVAIYNEPFALVALVLCLITYAALLSAKSLHLAARISGLGGTKSA